MADNIQVTQGTGTVMATDDISGVQYPRVKVSWGVDGSAIDASATNPLPVTATQSGAYNITNISGTVSLPTGAATETTLSAINNKTPSLITSPPSFDASANAVRVVGQNTATAGFSAVGASVLDTFFNSPVVGTGVSYNQASGSLNIVAGTTANAEFYARSVASFRGSMRKRFTITSSARIANNNFVIMLGDLLGETLSYNIVSTTVVDVTLTGHGFTAQNVGQFVNIGAITGAAGVPGRYAIASLPDANTIRFTVAGWPATGTGTCALFGRNYIRNILNGVSQTNIGVDAQRNGWATGDTSAVTNTSASPGTMMQVDITGREIFWSESLRASSATPTVTTRASRYENIPDQSIDLYVFLWSFNGTTNPASSTTWTLGHLSVESFANLPVVIDNVRSLGQQNPLPVSLQAGAAAIGNITTVSTVSTVTTVSTVSTVSSANMASPTTVADVTSAAITTTTTTTAFAPNFGVSYVVTIPVTAVSGTNPTMDVTVQESDDAGTNWYTVYDFPRITATGMYRSPKLYFCGNRIRYIQTIGGTTPSFTRAISHLQCSDTGRMVRQLIDRSISPTTLDSTTATLNTGICSNAMIVINMGAVTTAPVFQLEGSEDNGVSWFPIGNTVTSVANSSVQQTVANFCAGIIRARVSTAGTGATLGYVLIKGF